METIVLVALAGSVVVIVALAAGLWRSRPIAVRLEERERQVAQLTGERDRAVTERDEARAKIADAQTELARVQADQQARSEELEKARKELDTRFKGIAAGVIKSNSEALLKQAREQFEGQRKLGSAELEKREQAINSLVKPVGEQLAKLQEQVQQFEQKREGAYQKLSTQVGSLHDVASGLRDVLKSSSMRGDWGEQHLRNILELSGLREHVDFVQQVTVGTDENRGRPDAVVRVPKGVQVVIDAKTPLDSYYGAHEAGDELSQQSLLQSHATSLLAHAKTLGARDYSSTVNGSPDFVVMYVPTDPILDAAMDVRPSLWDDAWSKHRVLIATPGLLLAFLRTVALAWQQQEMQDNAQLIAKAGRELHDRLKTYVSHVDKVGKGLQQALKAHNASVGSLESRVLPQARRFEELGAVPGAKAIPQLDRVDDSTRPLSLLAEPDTDSAG